MFVEREGFAFSVEVQYERHPPFCSHCKNLGHSSQQCRKLGVGNGKEPADQSKRHGFKQAPKFKNMIMQANHGNKIDTEAAVPHIPLCRFDWEGSSIHSNCTTRFQK